MNMKKTNTIESTGDLLGVLGNPFRIEILYAIGRGEACVCHLEALLEEPQPKISQHLSVMRDAGVLETRREGKYIFYRLADLKLFDLLRAAAQLQGKSPDEIPAVSSPEPCEGCPCPSCSTKY